MHIANTILTFRCIAAAVAAQPPSKHLGQQEAGCQHGSCRARSRHIAASPAQITLSNWWWRLGRETSRSRPLCSLASCMGAVHERLLVHRQRRRRIVRRAVLVAAIRDEAHVGGAGAA